MTTGFSATAQYLETSEYGIRRSNMATVTQSRRSDLESLHDAWQECAKPNWDGDGAIAVEHVCYNYAYGIIEQLPRSVKSPFITGEPDGHMSLEWHYSASMNVSVSVSPDGIVYWASLIGTDKQCGSFSVIADLPMALLVSLSKVSV